MYILLQLKLIWTSYQSSKLRFFYGPTAGCIDPPLEPTGPFHARSGLLSGSPCFIHASVDGVHTFQIPERPLLSGKMTFPCEHPPDSSAHESPAQEFSARIKGDLCYNDKSALLNPCSRDPNNEREKNPSTPPDKGKKCWLCPTMVIG